MFYYFLEEGVQSPYLSWKEGFVIPEDSLKDWACLYRSTMAYVDSMGNKEAVLFPDTFNPNHDSTYFRETYLELRADSMVKQHFSLLLVVFRKKIVRVEFEKEKNYNAHPYLFLVEKFREEQRKRKLLNFLPPVPKEVVPQEEVKRHQEAINQVKCN